MYASLTHPHIYNDRIVHGLFMHESQEVCSEGVFLSDLPLTAWMAKYEEAPRPALLQKSSSAERRQSTLSDSNVWPTAGSSVGVSSGFVSPAGEQRELSFAEKVKAQNRLLSATTPSHIATSPDPDPSGPLPDYQRSDSFAHRSASSGQSLTEDNASLAEDETNLTREALEQEQRLRASAAQAGCIEAQLKKAQDIQQRVT